ncbi:hypothetical protein ACHWQZ_G005478 [Mnemiopsis leidyi]
MVESKLDPNKMTNEEAKIRFELACNDYIREPNTEAFDFVAQNAHRFTILEFVQLLQQSVTSKTDETRLNAMTLLVDVSVKSKLNDAEVAVLIKFLCGRLSEKYSIVPKILSGLNYFVRERELESDIACSIARDLFQSVDVQALHQDTRHKAYTLVYSLLHRNLLCLLKMNNEFVASYINLIDGEQDPRNLLLIFNMTVIVLQHFNLDNIEEAMFDVISCYYPIDFSPPEDSDVKVSPEDLRTRLNNCFKASNKLAKHAIPFLMEKFSSSIMQTRVQSCETLKLCITSYGIGCSEEHLTLIWNDVKQEIFGGVNRDLRERCLEVISALFWVLTIPNVKNKSLDPAQFMNTIFDYCKEKLSYSEVKYLRPTACILTAVVKSSGAGSGLVAEHCLDWLTDRFLEHTEIAVKSVLLDEIVTLLGDMQCEPARATAAANHFQWKKLEEMFLGAISDKESTELCTSGLCGISELLNLYHMTDQHKREDVETSPLLNVEAIVLGVYKHLSQTNDEDGLQILTVISREYPDLVNKLLLDKLLTQVDKGDSSARRMLSRLLVEELLVQHSPRLVKLLIQRGHVEIISLFTVALSYQESSEVIQFCQQFIFHQLLNYLIQLAVQEQDIEKAVVLFQEFTVALYKNRSPRTVDMTIFTETFTKSVVFQPFSCSSSHHQTMLTAIYSAVLTYGSMDCTFDPLMTPLDMTPVLKLACFSSDPITVQSSASIIGLMLNRMDEGEHLEGLKTRVFSELESCHMTNNKVWLCIRVCQALVYRWSSSVERAVKLFVECLTDKQTHSHTAQLTRHVLEPVYMGNRMILHKQRFLLTLIPLITPFINNSSLLSGEISSSLVKGVGTLLLALPQSLISTHGDTLYPVILNNLTPDTCDTASLKLVQYLISNTPGIIIMHLDSLVAQLCELGASREVSVRCRVEAVNTLKICTTQLHHKHTHVQREFVIKRLKTVLGDRKRVVRQVGAETLQQWVMLQPS